MSHVHCIPYRAVLRVQGKSCRPYVSAVRLGGSRHYVDTASLLKTWGRVARGFSSAQTWLLRGLKNLPWWICLHQWRGSAVESRADQHNGARTSCRSGLAAQKSSGRITYGQRRVFLVLIFFFLLFRNKISEFRINCSKFTKYFVKISRLIFVIIINLSEQYCTPVNNN